MNVKRKPHPFGNEYHTIACCLTHLIFYVELVEGKDRPTVGPHTEIEYAAEWGETAALCMRMTRPIWGSSRVVLLDSGFGYLSCLAALKTKGLYSTCVIKKRAHWPTGVEGNKVITEMVGKDVGTTRLRQGTKGDTKVWVDLMADLKHILIMGDT